MTVDCQVKKSCKIIQLTENWKLKVFDFPHVKLRLYEPFFACDGVLIFFKIFASPACGGGYSWQQNAWFCRKKFNSLNFLRFFSCDFVSCRITCAKLATHAIFPVHWWRDNFPKKLHHHCKQIIPCIRSLTGWHAYELLNEFLKQR